MSEQVYSNRVKTKEMENVLECGDLVRHILCPCQKGAISQIRNSLMTAPTTATAKPGAEGAVDLAPSNRKDLMLFQSVANDPD